MYNINSNLFRAAQTQAWLLSSNLSDNYSLATKTEWTFYYLIKSEFLYHNLSLIGFTFMNHFQPTKKIDSFKCFCTFFKQVEVMRKPRGWKNEYFTALSFKSTKKRLEKIPKFFFVWKNKDFAGTAFFQVRRKSFVLWADKYKRTFVLAKLTRIAYFFYTNSAASSMLRKKQLKPLTRTLVVGSKDPKVMPKKAFRILAHFLKRVLYLEDRWYYTMKPAIPDICRSSFYSVKLLQKVLFEQKMSTYFAKPINIYFVNVFTKLQNSLPFNKIGRDWQLNRYKKNKLRVYKDMVFALILTTQKPVIGWVLDLIANAFERNQKKQKQYIYFVKSLLSVLTKYGYGFAAYRIAFSGKLEGSRRTRLKIIQSGPLPLLTIDSMIVYARSTALTKYGAQDIKAWFRY